MVCFEEEVLNFSELICVLKLIFVFACHFAQFTYARLS